jgi:hypothetical protein
MGSTGEQPASELVADLVDTARAPGPRTRRASAGQRYIRWFFRQYYRDPYPRARPRQALCGSCADGQ